jgi:hypothetical protein
MPSNDSSPAECPPMCRCGHSIMSHDKLMRHTCIGNRNLCGCWDFVPKKTETTGEPDEHCINSGGCRYLVGSHCAHGCREAADAVTRLGQEMEPEAHEHDWTEWGAVYHGGDLQWRDCRACGDHETRLPEPEAPEGDPFDGAPDECLCGHDRTEHRAGLKAPYEGCNWCKCSQFIKDVWDHEVAPVPRRPPYAVAYEIGDGRLYEVALSGDAVATVEDGAVKISHLEGVKGIVQVKPYESEK